MTVDWGAAMRLLDGQDNVFVVGRGPALPVAREFALKLKEVCGIHAEATSAAEILHVPISIASPSLPAIVLAGDRYARPAVEAAVSRLRAAGAAVVLVATGSKATQEGCGIVAIPQAPGLLLEPVVAAQAAYPGLCGAGVSARQRPGLSASSSEDHTNGLKLRWRRNRAPRSGNLPTSRTSSSPSSRPWLLQSRVAKRSAQAAGPGRPTADA